MITKSLRYLGMLRRRRRPRLSAADLAAVTEFQNYQVDDSAKRRSNLITDENLHSGRDLYCDTAAIADATLKDHDNISVVVNVGARVDIISSYLAPKYSATDFISIDFQENLADHNRYLPQSPNWTFRSGYALDIFENGLRPSLAIFTSTACLFTPAELDAYLQAMHAKWLLFNEPVIPNIFGMGLHRHQNVWVHDYPTALTRAGYDVTRSMIVPYHKPNKPKRHIVLGERVGAAG